MASALTHLSLRGFRSILAIERLPLGALNVLIGANGAGKSNFIEFFRLVRALADGQLQTYIADRGGGDALFHLGPKVTPTISADLQLDGLRYAFELTAAGPDAIGVHRESVTRAGHHQPAAPPPDRPESMLSPAQRAAAEAPQPLFADAHASLSAWTVYHFHDTSPLAALRRPQLLGPPQPLAADAANLGPFLFHLQQIDPGVYGLIRDAIRLATPFFDDFLLQPERRDDRDVLRLRWRQQGTEFPFQAQQLSDGTLRYICLTTALLQPDPPATMIVDEPKLGLHPQALAALGEMIRDAATRAQLVVATQSPTLLDAFDVEQVIVTSREAGASVVRRLDVEALAPWAEDYSLGELWRKNVFRGGPEHE